MVVEVLRNVNSRKSDGWKDEASREKLVERTLCDMDRLDPEWEEEFIRGSVRCVWLNSVWARTTPPCVQTALSEDRVPKRRPVTVLKVVLKKRCRRSSSSVPDGSRPGSAAPRGGSCEGCVQQLEREEPCCSGGTT